MEKLHAYEFGYSGKDEMVDEMVDLMNKVLNTLDCKEVPFVKSEIIEYYKDTIFHNFDIDDFKADFIESNVIRSIGQAVMDYVNDSLDDVEKGNKGLHIDTDLQGYVTVIINGKEYDENKPRDYFIPMGDDYIALKMREIIDKTVYDSRELRDMVKREDIDIDSYGKNALEEDAVVITSYKADKSVEIPYKDIYNIAVSHLSEDFSYRSDDLMIAVSISAKIEIMKAIKNIQKSQTKDFQISGEVVQDSPLHIGIVDYDHEPQYNEEDNFINYYIAADDQTFKELVARTNLLQDESKSWQEIWQEILDGDDYIDMYVNAYSDHIDAFLYYKDKEYSVFLTAEEKQRLIEAMKKAGMDIQEDLQLEAYRAYKDSWIEEYISNEVMKQTRAIWENNEELQEMMPFENYIEEYGFSNGKKYASYKDFLDNKFQNVIKSKEEKCYEKI